MGWHSKTRRAKRRHRSSLTDDDWSRDKLYDKFPCLKDNICDGNNDYLSYLPFGPTPNVSYHQKSTFLSPSVKKRKRSTITVKIPVKLDAKTTSPIEFREQYERVGVPVIILNISECCDLPLPSCSQKGQNTMTNEMSSSTMVKYQQYPHQWEANSLWRISALASDPALENYKFKVGEDDEGIALRMKLKHFIPYLRNNKDDSPLYVFDATFDEDDDSGQCHRRPDQSAKWENKNSKKKLKYKKIGASRILKDYCVPSYFNDDLYGLVGENRRPPYRWFLIGPERSGTCIHFDPLGTSAWNTLVVGTKRWVLFPPHVPRSVVKGKGLIRKNEDDEAIHYFLFILPRIKKRAAEIAAAVSLAANTDIEKNKNKSITCNNLTQKDQIRYANFECYEFTQHEGETVYIPTGWWHAVLNLEHTVAITQNYCSHANFDSCWRKIRTGRKKMAKKFLSRLETCHPDLAQRAKELNRMDNFVMNNHITGNNLEKEQKQSRKAKKTWMA